LAGRLLSEQAEKWTVLRLPALAETDEERQEANKRTKLRDVADPLGRQPGEPLCPKRFSRETLNELKSDVGSLAWAAEYQGVPVVLEGTMFKRENFEIVDTVPAGARRVRYWDKAGTQGGGAYSAGVLMAELDGIYYVEDVKRGQWSSANRKKIMLQTAELDRALGPVTIWTEQEPGSGGKESAEVTITDLAGFDVHAETVTGDKVVRATPYSAQVEGKNVRLVRGSWNNAYLDELTEFPNGTYKDQTDASGGAFNKLSARKRGAGVI
jgi:predicted phage terminase large subunit-like protein